MNTERIAKIIASTLALTVIVSSASIAISAVRLKAIVEDAPTYTIDDWRTDEPPMSEPIIGVWYEGGVRARAVVMVYGAAYPYEPGVNVLSAIEYNRPDKWRLIP
jgi:hypothetical protein